MREAASEQRHTRFQAVECSGLGAYGDGLFWNLEKEQIASQSLMCERTEKRKKAVQLLADRTGTQTRSLHIFLSLLSHLSFKYIHLYAMQAPAEPSERLCLTRRVMFDVRKTGSRLTLCTHKSQRLRYSRFPCYCRCCDLISLMARPFSAKSSLFQPLPAICSCSQQQLLHRSPGTSEREPLLPSSSSSSLQLSQPTSSSSSSYSRTRAVLRESVTAFPCIVLVAPPSCHLTKLCKFCYFPNNK